MADRLIVTYNGIELTDQKWFNDFRWHNFEVGGVVWLEDHEESDKPAALFAGIKDGRVILRGTSYQNAYRIETRPAHAPGADDQRAEDEYGYNSIVAEGLTRHTR